MMQNLKEMEQSSSSSSLLSEALSPVVTVDAKKEDIKKSLAGTPLERESENVNHKNVKKRRILKD
jgi:hypothetical protein